MNFDHWKDAKWLPYTIAACSGVLLYYVLEHLNIFGDLISGIWKVITPLVLSLVLAYLMDPIVLFFENRICSRILKPQHMNTRRKLGVVLTVVSIILVIVLILLNLIPALIASLLSFFENFGDGVLTLETGLANLTSALEATGLDLSNLKESIITALEDLSGLINNGDLVNRSQALGSSMSSFVVGFILAIYLLIEKKQLVHMTSSFLKRFLGKDGYIEFSSFCLRCHHILMRYLGCTILEGIVVGCVNAIFMLIFGMPYVIIVSVIVGVTNLAPTFGPIIGCVLGMFILMLTNPILSLYFLVFTLILQTIDGYVIKPRLFGNTLGISPLLILISIILGGQLFGVLGILFAIPFSAIAGLAVTEYIFPYTRDAASGDGPLPYTADPAYEAMRDSREMVMFEMKDNSSSDEPDSPAPRMDMLQNPLKKAEDLFETITVNRRREKERRSRRSDRSERRRDRRDRRGDREAPDAEKTETRRPVVEDLEANDAPAKEAKAEALQPDEAAAARPEERPAEISEAPSAEAETDAEAPNRVAAPAAEADAETDTDSRE